VRPRAQTCPRCRVPMTYVQEVERSGSERRIVRYYRCPVCGLRLLDEVMRIVRVNGSVKIIIDLAKQGRVTVAVNTRGKHRRATAKRA